jgi:hypothetical protein
MGTCTHVYSSSGASGSQIGQRGSGTRWTWPRTEQLALNSEQWMEITSVCGSAGVPQDLQMR